MIARIPSFNCIYTGWRRKTLLVLLQVVKFKGVPLLTFYLLRCRVA